MVKKYLKEQPIRNEIDNLINLYYEDFKNGVDRRYIINFIFMRGHLLAQSEKQEQVERLKEKLRKDIKDFFGANGLSVIDVQLDITFNEIFNDDGQKEGVE